MQRNRRKSSQRKRSGSKKKKREVSSKDIAKIALKPFSLQHTPRRRGNVNIFSDENPLPPKELEDIPLPKIYIEDYESPDEDSDEEFSAAHDFYSRPVREEEENHMDHYTTVQMEIPYEAIKDDSSGDAVVEVDSRGDSEDKVEEKGSEAEGVKKPEEEKKEEKGKPKPDDKPKEKERKDTKKLLLDRWIKFKHMFEKRYYDTFEFVLGLLLFLGCMWNIVSVTYRVAFESFTVWYVLCVDIFFDVVFYFSLLVPLFVKPPSVESQKEHARKYYVSVSFVFSIGSILLPIDWFFPQRPLVRINRVISVFNVGKYLNPIEAKIELFMNLIYFRVVKYSLIMIILIHVFSCLWFWIAKLDSRYNNFIVPGPLAPPLLYNVLVEPPVAEGQFREIEYAYSVVRAKQYLGAIFFGSYYIVGFNAPFPQDTVQAVFSLVCVICGAGLFATLIGTVSSIIGSLGKTQQLFDEKMTKIKGFMRFKDVKKSIQKDVSTYYDLLEDSGRGIVSNELIFSDLDLALRRKVSLFLHRDLVKKVEIFQRCEEITSGLFIEDVCNYLKYILVLQGFTVVRFGEIGKTMYFIGKGEVDIISRDGVKLATLGRGNFFGEIALFLKKKRTAHVKAKRNCELYELHLDDLQKILQIHHECKILFYKEARRRYRLLKLQERESKKDSIGRRRRDVSMIKSQASSIVSMSDAGSITADSPRSSTNSSGGRNSGPNSGTNSRASSRPSSRSNSPSQSPPRNESPRNAVVEISRDRRNSKTRRSLIKKFKRKSIAK